MTQFLPPNLLALFAPRDPIPYLPPVAKLPHEKKTRGYLGVGNFMDLFEVCIKIYFKLFKVQLFLYLIFFRILKIHLLQQKLKHEKKDWTVGGERKPNK